MIPKSRSYSISRKRKQENKGEENKKRKDN